MKKLFWLPAVVICLFFGVAWADETECTHAFRGYYDGYYNAVYSSITTKTHTISGNRATICYCLECNATLSEEVEEEVSSRVADHWFSNGKCTGCGAYAECSHPVESEPFTSYRSVTYTPLDHVSHTVSGYKYLQYRCPVCTLYYYYNRDVDSEVSSATEEHSFFMGICTACGYGNTCTHPETETVSDSFDAIYTRLDENSHQVSHFPATCDHCLICQDYFNYQVSDKRETIAQAHTFENGICTVCGYGFACDHAETFEKHFYTNLVYTPHSASSHEYKGNLVQYTACQICGEWIQEQTSEEAISKFEPHSFEEGVCTLCDYVNTCSHDNIRTSTYFTDATYTYQDEKHHLLTGHVVSYSECLLCGEVLSEETSEDLQSELWEHVYQDGTCHNCGFTNPCAHTDVRSGQYLSDAQYSFHDENSHIATGHVVFYTTCNLCNEKLSEEVSEEIQSMEENHYYQNGVCYECGHENTCNHPNRSEDYNYNHRTYSDITEKTHTVTGYKVTYEYCYDCDQELSYQEETEKSSMQEEHWWDQNGFCECGYKNTCSHPNPEKHTSFTDTTYVYQDDTIHFLIGYEYTWYWCTDCGNSWEGEVSQEPVTQEENHSFRNGVCFGCGFENPCPHANVNEYTEFENCRYTFLNLLGHLKVGKATTHYYCYDCNDQWTATGDEVAIMEKHIFDEFYEPYYYTGFNGDPTCDHCGYTVNQTLMYELNEQFTNYTSPAVQEAVSALGQEMILLDGGVQNDFFRYGYLPGDSSASLLKNFSIYRPAVTLESINYNLYGLGASAEWAIIDQYNAQLKGVDYPDGATPIDLQKLSSFFGDYWKESKALNLAMGYTAAADGTFYAWVPVYYEGAQGQIEQDALYLYLYKVQLGMDKEYLEGKIYYPFDLGFRSESFLITDARTVSSFLQLLNQEKTLTADTEDSTYYYDLALGQNGSAVKKIQAALVELGYLNSSVDGYYGPVTEAAVKAYQEAMGLKANGVADEALQRTLLSDTDEKHMLAQWLLRHQ